MVWVRRLVALLITVAFLAIFGVATFGLAGVMPPLGSAPGLSQEDADALSAPYADLIAGREDVLMKRFAAGVDLSNAAATFEEIRSNIPPGTLKSSRLVNWFVTTGPNVSRLAGVHEHIFPEHAIRVETELVRSDAGSPWQLLNFNVRWATAEQLAPNKFSFFGSPLFVKITVVATFAVLVFSFATAVATMLLKDVSKRWLWLLFVIVGFGTFRMDMNGAWGVQPISFQLFSGSFLWSGSPFQPWVFAVSIPVGAILFWARRSAQKPPVNLETAF